MQYVNGGIKNSQPITKVKPRKLCKKCKDRKRYGNLSLCFQCFRSREKEKSAAKAKARLEKVQKSKKYQKSLFKKLHAKAWELQKQYLRKRSVNFQGYVECYTGGEMIPEKESQCGHFHHGKLDFDLRNIHLQCAGDNLYKSGNLTRYAARLVAENGQEWFLQLDRDASRHKGYAIQDLEKIITKYQELLKTL
jgi:hypothetical protein